MKMCLWATKHSDNKDGKDISEEEQQQQQQHFTGHVTSDDPTDAAQLHV